MTKWYRDFKINSKFWDNLYNDSENQFSRRLLYVHLVTRTIVICLPGGMPCCAPIGNINVSCEKARNIIVYCKRVGFIDKSKCSVRLCVERELN